MIKKNDCVPKNVLNQQKLRRQAIVVMIGGLVVAFLLGLIIGWFIPKNDKKNVTASAEVVVPDTNPQTSFYPVVGGFSLLLFFRLRYLTLPRLHLLRCLFILFLLR